MLINSFTDGDYFINDYRYTALLSNTTELGNPNLFASDMTMTVQEPHGIMFMNSIKDLMDNKTEAGMAGTFFIIKTIFVGHTASGKTEYIYDMVKPIVGLLISLSGSFAESGGIYKLGFVDVTNGAAALHSQIGYVYESMKISGATLGECILSFETSLNKALKDAQDKISAAQNLQSQPSSNATDSKDGNKNAANTVGKMVNYKFTLPKSWLSFKMDGGQRDIIQTMLEQKVKEINDPVQANPTTPPEKPEDTKNQPPKTEEPKKTPEQEKRAAESAPPKNEPAPVDNTPTELKNTGNVDKNKNGVYIGSSVRAEIDEILKEIFKHCIDIQKLPEKNKEFEKQGKYADMVDYKIQNCITSDEKTYTVHYDVITFPLMPPKTKDVSQKTNATQNASTQQASARAEAKKQVDANFIWDEQEQRLIPKRGIVFDYIFSGKNVDIIDFKMEMDQGLIYLQKDPTSLDGITGFSSGSAPYISRNEPMQPNSPANLKSNVNIRKGDPIFLPQRSVDGQKAYNYATAEHAQSREEYIKMMSEISALSVIQMEMTIRGNPSLIEGAVQKVKPHNFNEYLVSLQDDWKAAKDDVANTYSGNAVLAQTNYLMHPLLVKVNVFTPNSFVANKSQQYTTPFWYKGWWLCYKIDNIFSNGSFTQLLHMNAYLLNMGADNLGVLDDESLNNIYGIKPASKPVKGTGVNAGMLTPQDVKGTNK